MALRAFWHSTVDIWRKVFKMNILLTKLCDIIYVEYVVSKF